MPSQFSQSNPQENSLVSALNSRMNSLQIANSSVENQLIDSISVNQRKRCPGPIPGCHRYIDSTQARCGFCVRHIANLEIRKTALKTKSETKEAEKYLKMAERIIETCALAKESNKKKKIAKAAYLEMEKQMKALSEELDPMDQVSF
jgi:hypothetical protein